MNSGVFLGLLTLKLQNLDCGISLFLDCGFLYAQINSVLYVLILVRSLTLINKQEFKFHCKAHKSWKAHHNENIDLAAIHYSTPTIANWFFTLLKQTFQNHSCGWVKLIQFLTTAKGFWVAQSNTWSPLQRITYTVTLPKKFWSFSGEFQPIFVTAPDCLRRSLGKRDGLDVTICVDTSLERNPNWRLFN